jgi:cysteine-rich repeat protein
MYWTTVDGFLASARLDGSDGESLPISYAVGLAIDLGARQLYFSSQFYEDLRRTNLDYPSGGDRLVSGVRVFRFALEVCGSGLVDPGEECDAGGASAECDGDCTAVQCGDGVVNSAAGEQCDDGNDVGGDGCAPDCSLAAVPAAYVRGSVAAMLLLLLATAWRSRPSARPLAAAPRR